VTKVPYDGGRRTSVKVPFRTGLAADPCDRGVAADPYDGKSYVSAWSIADRNGVALEGKKTPSGQVWKILGF
jgi:hypothetical protein